MLCTKGKLAPHTMKIRNGPAHHSGWPPDTRDAMRVCELRAQSCVLNMFLRSRSLHRNAHFGVFDSALFSSRIGNAERRACVTDLR